MTIETGIYSRMSGDGTLAGLVSTRIWPLDRQQNSVLPCVTYKRRDGDAEYGLWDAPVLLRPLWEFDCYGETYASARAVADRVRALFDRLTGDVGGAFVAATLLGKDEGESVEVNGSNVVRARLWFRMIYQE